FTPKVSKKEPDFRRWIIVHRMPFWIYIRIPRPYKEILSEIILYLKKEHDLEYHLFVTCPPESEFEVRQILSSQMLPHTVYVYENKGRDVLPFLKILPDIQRQGFEYILKIHTKKSSHHINNAGWKKDIFEKLLAPGSIVKYTSLLHTIPEIGMIGPEGHILPMAMYYSNNAEKVSVLCRKMGLSSEDFPKLHFIAGTMFYAKMEALQPILDIKLQEEEFDIEDAQVDGTMAHAIERAFGASCLKQDLWLVDTQSSSQLIHSKSVMNYKFSI
ncbi:MAG: rhamnan synthesis F family protein, partial [Saprospiraceae bacterium]|nr:rhamnan synthesis F family protein [Saprospiraceae bacterium]